MVTDALDQIRSAATDDPALARRGIAFTEELLAQLPDADEPFRAAAREACAALLAMADRPVDARNEAESLMKDLPEQAAGYVAYADVLTHEGDESSLDDLKAAVGCIEAALRRPVLDGEEYELDLTLERLRSWLALSDPDRRIFEQELPRHLDLR